MVIILDADVIVAATARHRGSQVATFNRKHFENVQGLTLVELAGGTTKTS
jgi:predicted nucleic acid-binding protein